MNPTTSRRNFLAGSTGFAAAGFAALANPIATAAQSADVKPGDLPDLTIKEVKVYVTDISKLHKLNGSETGELISVVTNSGIEGNYTIGDRDITAGMARLGQAGARRQERHRPFANADLDYRHESSCRI